MKLRRLLMTASMAVATLGLSTSVFASYNNYKNYNRTSTYKVTVQNITKGTSFTPLLGASHKRAISFFTVGEPALPQLAELAESGNTAPLEEALTTVFADQVTDTATSAGLLGPGEKVELEIDANRWRDVISVSAMILPTNDAFIGLRNARLPRYGKAKYYVRAYDAGSEANSELCADIPGPVACEGVGVGVSADADSDEGFVYPSPGISGEGEISALEYNWSDPVAIVTIERI